MNVDVARRVVADSQDPRCRIECVSGFAARPGKLLALTQRNSIGHDRVRHEVESQHVAGRRIKRRIRDRTRAVLRNRPKRVHHAARAVGKLVGEPPLVAERRMSSAWQALKIRHPVVRTIRRFLVRPVAGLREVKRFHRGEPRSVAVATLIRQIAAERFAVTLLRGDGRSVNNIFRPLWRGLHPID